jgi:phosphoribosylaminoimidazolecarboxamide formyltransferase/IMP cyclohydrolase
LSDPLALPTTQDPRLGTVRVRRALLSVFDKSGLLGFAADLKKLDIELIATGGTAQALAGAELPVTRIEDITKFPEILDGRIKTLHPAIFAGILARPIEAHESQLESLGLEPIDLVAVDLYPFERSGASAPMEEALELIDIGGVSLLRAAAKNWERVAAVSNPDQYRDLLTELQRTGGVSEETRRRLARAAFARTAAYDAAIATYFAGPRAFPERLTLPYRKLKDLRYGENPHQRGALYVGDQDVSGTVAAATQVQGKELSFNNLADLGAAWELVHEFVRPAAAVVKHAAPCGAAVGETAVEAYRSAYECDPVSAFGGVVAFNREIDEETAQAVTQIFTEVVIAPAVTEEAKLVFKRKQNLRLLEAGWKRPDPFREVRSISGGILVQDADARDLDEVPLRVVTPRAPTPQEMEDLLFAWKVVKWVRSNAIVLAKNAATVGIGGGQPNRVGSVMIAVRSAGDRAKGSVLASDAFFPFRDGVDEAARAGVTAVIQPGGSVRDEEAIAAATEHDMAMVFTGIRRFRH